MNSFERFNQKNCVTKYFFSLTKKGKIGHDGKISDGHLRFKDYLISEKKLG